MGHVPLWNTVVMLTGIIVSRAGSSAFNLAQTKQLQLTLADLPQRNRMTALQSALMDLFDLVRFALTLIFSAPEDFKWTAAVTMAAHVVAILVYTFYMKKQGYFVR